MKIAVYTCITNNYEPLQKQQNFNGADWFIFSDTEVDDDHWIYLPAVKLFQDPRRNARYHKMLPHLYFGEYDYWVWVDGSIQVTTDIAKFVKGLNGSYLSVLAHPDRNCAYQEIRACKSMRLDKAEILDRETAKLQKAGYPRNNGLAETKVVVRRNVEKVIKFNQCWFLQMAMGTVRDQVNFNYAAWKTKTPIKYLPSIKEIDGFIYHKHYTNRTYQ